MSEILSLITEFEDLKNAPESSLKWMINNGEIREYQKGDHLFKKDEIADHLHLILSGCIRFYGTMGKQKREFARNEGGLITGVLPYSRMKIASGNGEFLEPSRVLSLHRDHFPEMIREHHDLTRCFVHLMTNRVRNFTSLQFQNEKLAALGKLSAGLAHELNNPASAIVRSANELQKHLQLLPEGFKSVIKIRMTDEQVDSVNNLMFGKLKDGFDESLSLSQKMEKEDELLDWLEDHSIEEADDIAANLVEFGFTEEDLDTVFDATSEQYFQPVINWINNNLTTEKMVKEIAEASSRIAGLISSVKSYSHMDQSLDRRKVDIHAGIRSTLRMLQFKIRKAQVEVKEDFDPSLTHISGYPGELNQIWTNLIDNALDAMDGGAEKVLELKTLLDNGVAFISVIDSGTGIPEDVQAHIFDPFYTTKEVGQGTGLGLDVVQKIVNQHNGSITVDSHPGRTEFKLSLPAD